MFYMKLGNTRIIKVGFSYSNWCNIVNVILQSFDRIHVGDLEMIKHLCSLDVNLYSLYYLNFCWYILLWKGNIKNVSDGLQPVYHE